jgi:hypothetical protein
MSALVKGMENGMKEALIAIGGLEKVRVEQQEIPANQRHSRIKRWVNHPGRLRHPAQRAAHQNGHAGMRAKGFPHGHARR